MEAKLRWNTKVTTVTTFLSTEGSKIKGYCRSHQFGPLSPVIIDGREFWECEECLKELTGDTEKCCQPKLCELCGNHESFAECAECSTWMCLECSVQGVCRDCDTTLAGLGRF